MGRLTDSSAIQIAIQESDVMINPEWGFTFTATAAADQGVRLHVVHRPTGFEQAEYVSPFNVTVTQFMKRCATAIALLTKRLRDEIADDRWVKTGA